MRIISGWLFFVIFLSPGYSPQITHAGDDASSMATPSGVTAVAAVTLHELEQARGQGGVINVTQLTNAQLNADLGDNTAIGNVTGSNIIDDSFSRASGLFSIIQNTGNNVIIQDSVIVNVTIFP